MNLKKIKSALISVYDKSNLEPIISKLQQLSITIYSTGGTQEFIESLGFKAIAVESITSYPSILGGRVKTLHPKVFGGILARRYNTGDLEQMKQYEIPEIDLVIVDLYPFEKTFESGAPEQEVIEKIDIGGISLIRAAAKNYRDVAIIASADYYGELLDLLKKNEGSIAYDDRRRLAAFAFDVTSHYDTAIFNFFNTEKYLHTFKRSVKNSKILRYGENPHQEGIFYGNLNELFEQLHGKELSYNNLLDIDAAISIIAEFNEPTFAILKHNNACGIASRKTILEAWKCALAGDPISAFGGVLITNSIVNLETAEEINKLFFEVIIAPSYEKEAIARLQSKKNRIILILKKVHIPKRQFRSLLNGVIEQDKDPINDKTIEMKVVSETSPSTHELSDLIFAMKVVKHTKSNAIVLAKNKQLLASGVGQTSRVDALKQAIAKANEFEFDLKGSVMASDAFFPFPDCAELAHNEGITAIIQPGGSVNDNLSVDFCDKNKISMIFTGVRHFKH